jgi:uncharacterized membrane protein YcaP (DUF421 family)
MTVSAQELASAAVAALAIYVFVIVATRLSGLRSFATMSSFDFAMTVAIGSLIASAASGQVALAAVATGIAVLYVAQAVVAVLRRHGLLAGLVDNSPLLLIENGQILEDNLASARMTRDDLRAKLREANVHEVAQVHAVVFETTGDVSVLHGDGQLDPDLLQGVRRRAEGRA